MEKRSNNAKTQENVPILDASFVSISSWHFGHTSLIGYSPRLTTICCDEILSMVVTLDGD